MAVTAIKAFCTMEGREIIIDALDRSLYSLDSPNEANLYGIFHIKSARLGYNGSDSKDVINHTAALFQADWDITPGPIYIASKDPAPGDPLIGKLDDCRFYNRIISLAEVQTIYTCRGHDNITYGLTNRWIMNEKNDGETASGTGAVKDIIGNNNMTPVNSPIYADSVLNFRRRSR